MAEEIRLPALGQTSDEMSIVEWYKEVGDTIAIAEPLLCVETDKAQVDVESAEEGVLLRIVAQPGESLSTGALLAFVGRAGEELPTEDVPTEDLPGDPVGPPEPTTPVVAAVDAVESSPPQAAPVDGGGVQASPLVRKLARDLGVDIETVRGTGPAGRVEREDVEALTLGSPPKSASDDDTVALTPARRTIARRLSVSATIPAFALTVDLDATRARERLAATPGSTYTHLLLRAVAAALREHPEMLAVWADETALRRIPRPDIGLAVAGDGTLLVVTIAEPDARPLEELVSTTAAAVSRARAGTLTEADRAPAALSISNLGMFGISSFTAIVDPEQTAILAVGAVEDRVVARHGGMQILPMITVTLSCDHRVVDGAAAARFLQTAGELFEASDG